MNSRAAVVTALVLVAGLVPAGCSRPTSATVAAAATATAETAEVVHLGYVSRLADRQVEAFEDELAVRAPGRVNLAFEDEAFPSSRHGVEQQIVRGVADGRLDLGWVGVRAFRELGVHDLDALVAPMVLDSVGAEEAVLASDLPQRMLAGVEPLGVTGLAIVAGPLRRPVAAGRPLTTLSSFEGVPFYSWHGDVNAASVTALGAVNVDVAPPDRNAGIADGSIRGYETTVGFLADNADWRANIMTANVNLWPSMSVLIARPAFLAALPADVRSAIEAAAKSAAAGGLAVAAEDRGLVDEACRAGARFARATAPDIKAIEEALRPVIDELRTDPVVASHLDSIARLTKGLPPDSLSIPYGCAAAPTQE